MKTGKNDKKFLFEVRYLGGKNDAQWTDCPEDHVQHHCSCHYFWNHPFQHRRVGSPANATSRRKRRCSPCTAPSQTTAHARSFAGDGAASTCTAGSGSSKFRGRFSSHIRLRCCFHLAAYSSDQGRRHCPGGGGRCSRRPSRCRRNRRRRR